MSHAFLSPSGAYAWTKCLAKPWREKDLPEEPSAFAEEGRRAHECLEAYFNGDLSLAESSEMADAVLATHKFIVELAEGYAIFPEQILPIGHITGELGATGTADAVIVKPTEIIIVDFKYGKGKKIYADNNKQLLMYASAALEYYDLIGDIKTVRMCIAEPRLNHIDEVILSASELRDRIAKIKSVAHIIKTTPPEKLKATPGEEQCQFCKAKGNCVEYHTEITSTLVKFHKISDDPVPLADRIANSTAQIPLVTDSEIADAMDALPMVESWCKAVKEQIYNRLLHDNFKDSRYKLVEGGRGNRKWADEEKVTEYLSSHWAGTVHEKLLLSPARLEKLIKPISPEVWAKLESDFIGRREAKLIPVRSEDARTAAEITIKFDPVSYIEYTESLIGMTKES